AINIGFIRAECRYFERMPAMNDKDDAELRADALGARKDLHDLFRPRAGRDVVIRRLDAHDHIAHAPADEIGFVSPPAKIANDVDRRVRFHAVMIASFVSNTDFSPP